MPKKKYRSPLIEKLETLCEGLVYTSEIDSEITPFVTEKISSGSTSQILSALERPETEAEEIDFDKFFENLTTDHAWFDATERDQARQFGELKKFLQENVEAARVFRFGKTKVEIYVVGTDPGGHLMGVKTEAVET